jgi:DNA-binding MarR family transcriptional regulator
MSRTPERDDAERLEEATGQSRMPLSQGRAGGAGSGPVEDETRGRTSGAAPHQVDRLAETISRIASTTPTMSGLIEQLEREGVKTIPSIQSGGRLNGMSYEFNGVRINGSTLGRAYTAQGLQCKLGVNYDPKRDDPVLARALARVPIEDRKRTWTVAERDPTMAQGERQARTRRERDHHGLNINERQILNKVGTFRVVSAKDLQRQISPSNPERFRQDVKRLVARGLVESQSVPYDKKGDSVSILTLTKAGLKAARSDEWMPQKQRLYAGFVKPNEVKHDLAIFRMYEAHSAKIESAGGNVQRVVLDFELKKAVYSELAKANGLPALEYARKKDKIAAENGLKTVEGRVILPDLRIEYETADGELAKVDLEVTSEDYKRSQMQQKARAGFTVYALGLKASSRCSAIQDGPEVVAGLLSF